MIQNFLKQHLPNPIRTAMPSGAECVVRYDLPDHGSAQLAWSVMLG
jgi:hypothetical protein